MDNNNVSIVETTNLDTADVTVPVSVATIVRATSPTILDNTVINDTNFVSTIDNAVIKSITSSVALVSSTNAASVQAFAQVTTIIITNSTTVTTTKVTVPASA